MSLRPWLLWQVLRPMEEPSFWGQDNEERVSQVMVTTQKMNLWCGNNHVNQSLGDRRAWSVTIFNHTNIFIKATVCLEL